MEAATEHTIQQPSVVLKELQLAMASGPEVAHTTSKKTVSEPENTGQVTESVLLTGGEHKEPALIDVGVAEQVKSARSEVQEAVQATQQPVVVRLPGKKPVRIKPSANLPHSPASVKQWIGTVKPTGTDHPTDMGEDDTFDDRESLYEDPPQHEEEMPSDAGSIRSEVNMFKLYVEGQLEETRRYMEEQMRSTHDLLTKIETRLAILEKRINLPESRPTSVSIQTRPVPLQALPTTTSSKASAQTASTSTVTLGGGLTELPLYSPNKVIQVRTLNRQLSSQQVTLQPIQKAIPRKDWNLQYINSLPVYKY